MTSDCIIDIRVTDIEAASYITRDPAKVLATHEQQKKKKKKKKKKVSGRMPLATSLFLTVRDLDRWPFGLRG